MPLKRKLKDHVGAMLSMLRLDQTSVQEGIKEFEKQNLTSAMECYKRAMDMDGKYAEAYYRVAEV